jgi:hypothetical protein
MTPEDLIEIERAGRRCAMCHTGRRWRQFSVVRVEGQEPVVMCPACTARYAATPPASASPTGPASSASSASEPAAGRGAAQSSAAPAAKPAASARAQRGGQSAASGNGQSASGRGGQSASGNGKSASERGAQSAPAADGEAAESAGKSRSAPREDRLRKALRELPHGEHSVARIAKAAGLNHEKTVRRLQTLHAAGEVQQVGKRWSNEPPSTDIEAAMDRLQARTTNLRIVRDRG